jgi:hypothetical protein
LAAIISLIDFQIALSDDSYIISQEGIPDYIEIGMTISELSGNGISAGDYDQEFFTVSGKKIYRILSSSVEFELKNERIIRIWFFANKERSFQILLANDNVTKNLNKICASDILRNFGEVKKFIGTKPPKSIDSAHWDRNSYFGVSVNTIHYPALPFTFGLADNDCLEYVTVTKKK